MSGERLYDDLIVSRETIDRLNAYVALLHKWSPRINLVSKFTLDDAWERHVLDSAQMLPILPAGTAHVVDLGSGAGFPGLVLAILTATSDEPFSVTLVESDRRKGLFLREVIRATDARAEVVTQRAETLAISADVVTARGFAALDRLLGMAAPIIGETGVAIVHKGARYESELTDAARNWHMEVEQHTSRTDPAAAILKIGGLRRR